MAEPLGSNGTSVIGVCSRANDKGDQRLYKRRRTKTTHKNAGPELLHEPAVYCEFNEGISTEGETTALGGS